MVDLAHHHRLAAVGEHAAEEAVLLLLQQFVEGEHHVIGSQRLAILPLQNGF
ncbi:hypothetical protein D3C76_1564620 [compost metagenome]